MHCLSRWAGDAAGPHGAPSQLEDSRNDGPSRERPVQKVARGELAFHHATSAPDFTHRGCGVGSLASSHVRASDAHTTGQSFWWIATPWLSYVFITHFVELPSV